MHIGRSGRRARLVGIVGRVGASIARNMHRHDGRNARNVRVLADFLRNHVSHAFQIGTRNAEFGKLVERQILQALGVFRRLVGGQVRLKLVENVFGERALLHIARNVPRPAQRRDGRIVRDWRTFACFLISRKEQMHGELAVARFRRRLGALEVIVTCDEVSRQSIAVHNGGAMIRIFVTFERGVVLCRRAAFSAIALRPMGLIGLLIVGDIRLVVVLVEHFAHPLQ